MKTLYWKGFVIFGCILIMVYVTTRYYMGSLYTPEWAARNFFWIAGPVILIPALFRKIRFAVLVLAGYLLGLLAGELFGGFAQDIPPCYVHYGWCILLMIFAVSCIIGGFCQKRKSTNHTLSNQ